jgi:serine/threonine protein kinase
VGNRPVALKVLNRKLLDDPDFLLRFQNEAGSTGRIRHANVVTIHESGQADDGTPYIAMEFLEGESLREVIKRRGALPVPEVADILRQAARGLHAAHKLGIIHRDLKPDNIFLTQDDEGELVVKVVDFGIAKLRESAMHTQTGMVLGTPAYMSFEQACGVRSDELAARSDVYSLGVVAYEMLTGQLPFRSDTPAGFLRKHMLEEPPPFRAVAQGLSVPSQVEAVVMKALKKGVDERYQSTLEFAHAFVAAALPVPSAELDAPLLTTKVVLLPGVPEFDAAIPEAIDPISQSGKKELTEHVNTPTQTEYIQFFSRCLEALKKLLPRDYVAPSAKFYYEIPTGLGGVNFVWSFHGRPRSSFGVELHFEKGNKEQNQSLMSVFAQLKGRLETETREPVVIQQEWGKTRARMFIEKQQGKITDDLVGWAVEKMHIFIQVLQPELVKRKNV